MDETLLFAATLLVVLMVVSQRVLAAPEDILIPNVNISVDGANSPEDYVSNIKLLIILTILTLLPSFIIMLTSFTRTIVVFLFKKCYWSSTVYTKPGGNWASFIFNNNYNGTNLQSN